MLYPLKFYPVYKDYPWGGRNLEAFGKKLPDTGIVAESWELSCHPNGQSVVRNGPFEGEKLEALVARFGRALLGFSLPDKDLKKFPLLVKFIDAEANLSVQVHPDDRYAYENENGEYGKNEMWYILSARPGARIIYDVAKGTDKQSMLSAIKAGNIESCLKKVEVHAGDVINIPTGLIHAIGEGIILAEVQQNSDTTYRLYDFGRKGRQLHIDKALDVIDFAGAGRKVVFRGLELSSSVPGSVSGDSVSGDSVSGFYRRTILAATTYFCAELIELNGCLGEKANGNKFKIFTCIKGEGQITYFEDKSKPKFVINTDDIDVDICNGNDTDNDNYRGSTKKYDKVDFSLGETVLLPASLGEFSLEGDFSVFVSYVPDLYADVLEPLRQSGYNDLQISENVGGMTGIFAL
ncbi:MAG: class I mannose-6-phosphate isomerase [Clostridiales bacterium]|nr:class I mannose-6-phosphate isomerase [Clostridiales bacterium]